MQFLLTTVTGWVDRAVDGLTWLTPADSMWHNDLVMRGCLAIVLVSLISGSVGSLVVSNRMSFFSDALAHCAFAGAAFGLLIALFLEVDEDDFQDWITLICVLFGIAFGLLIAYVHEKSLLPSDTVIGVFFAGALGLGGMFARAVQGKRRLDLESFIFGNPQFVDARGLLWLMLLLVLTAVFLLCCYNSLVFGSFNDSLARSRRVPSRLARYLFIVLLSLIVNLCQQTVGVLLINGLLIVPAATASNLSNNLRQLLWFSIVLAFLCGVSGMALSLEINNMLERRHVQGVTGIGGTVLVLSVVLFVLSLAWGRNVKRWGGVGG